MKQLGDEVKRIRAIMQQPLSPDKEEQQGESPPEVGMAQPVAAPPPILQEVPDPVTQAKRHIAKMANAFNLCMEGVDKLVAPNAPQTSARADFFERITMAFFIELKQMRFVDKMPSKPIKKE